MSWDSVKIEEEKKILKEYGLRRKKEIRRIEAVLRNFRRRAREIIATKDEAKKKVLLDKLIKMGLITKAQDIDDVLALTVKDILNRRLQTIVLKKKLANTINQSRQFIVHGHIAVDKRRVKFPSYIVPLEEEGKIEFYDTSKLKK
jgi:small subunit ribosomal protein S4